MSKIRLLPNLNLGRTLVLLGMLLGTCFGQSTNAKPPLTTCAEPCGEHSGGGAGPFTVTAIHVPAKSRMIFESSCDEDSSICSGDTMSCSNNGHPAKESVDAGARFFTHPKCEGGWTWGCKNPKAVLLTTQDGEYLCVKF